MAIKLKVIEDNTIKLKVNDGDAFTFKAEQGIPIYPNQYQGPTEVTPGESLQTLETRGLMMTDHVKVNPIPNNYGLITFNGTTITVS